MAVNEANIVFSSSESLGKDADFLRCLLKKISGRGDPVGGRGPGGWMQPSVRPLRRDTRINRRRDGHDDLAQQRRAKESSELTGASSISLDNESVKISRRFSSVFHFFSCSVYFAESVSPTLFRRFPSDLGHFPVIQ